MMTRQECVRRYGPIDFAARHWADQHKWLKMLEVPTGWFPHWHVMDTIHPVEHIACNLDLHIPLLTALKHVHEAGLAERLHNFGGCFNIRMVRGSHAHFSAHSYGLALDLNTHENPLGATHGGFYDEPKLVKCFTDVGFTWGGAFHGRKDAMHFSWSGF